VASGVSCWCRPQDVIDIVTAYGEGSLRNRIYDEGGRLAARHLAVICKMVRKSL